MDTDKGLEEIQVRKLLRLWVKFPNSKSLLESLLNLRFIFLLDPNQNEVGISGLQCFLGSSYHWTIHPVTMSKNLVRHKNHNCEENGPTNQWNKNIFLFHNLISFPPTPTLPHQACLLQAGGRVLGSVLLFPCKRESRVKYYKKTGIPASAGMTKGCNEIKLCHLLLLGFFMHLCCFFLDLC